MGVSQEKCLLPLKFYGGLCLTAPLAPRGFWVSLPRDAARTGGHIVGSNREGQGGSSGGDKWHTFFALTARGQAGMIFLSRNDLERGCGDETWAGHPLHFEREKLETAGRAASLHYFTFSGPQCPPLDLEIMMVP